MDFANVWHSINWATVLFVVEFAVKVAAVGIVPEKRHPSTAQAWLLLILVIPIVGVPLYLMLGSPYVRGRRHAVQEQATIAFAEATDRWPLIPEGVEVEEHFAQVVQMNRSLTNLPASTGRCRGVYSEYGESFRAMTAAVERAEHTVHVEFYAQAWDDETDAFFSALVAAAERGVLVRVLADHLGSAKYGSLRTIRRRMTAAGAQFHTMLPISPLQGRFRRPDLRNHRKILTIDGREGFVGSQNLIGRHYGSRRNARVGREWVDVMMHVSGEVVDALDAIFATDWLSESGKVIDNVLERLEEYKVRPVGGEINAFQVVPSGPGYPGEPSMRMFTQLINNAMTSVRLVSPYFIPNEAFLEAMKSAVLRGVDVELLVPRKADQFAVHHAQQSYFRELLEAGIRIYRFPQPKVLHAKLMLVDDRYTYFGSSNMDIRSFMLNFEVSVLTFAGDAAELLGGVIDSYEEVSTVLTLEQWMERPLIGRYFDNVFRLTSALQ
ncbi:cardiolipin synthase [Dietzia sp.]|uniref:cardiolipin synthase n=1 Tax=Dietzia sp. TaxID=1871616 RepID=UPI002FD92862